MSRDILPRRVLGRVNVWFLASLALLTVALLSTVVRDGSQAQEPAGRQPLAEPPGDQTYVGTKECAACHFEQFMTWRASPHAKAFDILPAKYRGDASCLECHTTGYGEPTGFKSLQETPNLVGNSCENCHGPGSKHTEVAKSFGQKRLTDEETAYVSSTIYLMQPKNVCVECHMVQGHKEHPKYDK